MAKEKERKALKKGKASFNLIGSVKITDKTFNLNNTYDSGWTDNIMYVGIDCGQGNVVYAEMRGGFFPDRDNKIFAFSKEDKDANGRSQSVEIAWEDRFDGDILDTISDSSFVTVGVEKDTHNKTLYKKFLSAYDAIEYLAEYLVDGTIVNVKGNISYSEYDGNVSAKKEITSIVLSRVEDESDFKAVFQQTILLDSKSIGKKDNEKGTIELDAYVVDYVGSPKIDGKKVAIKKYISYPKTFEVEVNSEKPDVTIKMLQKFFKAKKDSITELTVTGSLIEGGSIVNITDDDIPDDIKELIEMGIYTEEEAEKKIAVGSGSREKRMVIKKPDIVYVGSGDDRKPTVAFEADKYSIDDLYFYEQALLDAGVDISNNDDSEPDNEDDDELMKMLDEI